MSTFAYQVRDKSGKKLKGFIHAISQKTAADQLAEQGFLITQLNIKNPNPLKGLTLFGTISADELTMFYFQLSNLLESGIPVLASLQSMAEQVENRKFRAIILKLSQEIQNGASLSEAMNREPELFSSIYRSMVKVGETSGKLSENLRHIADLNESRSELHQQIISSLTYPALLMVASLAVIIFMIVWIIPTFVQIFTRSGIPLPLPTRVLFQLSQIIKQYPVFILITTFVTLIGLRLALYLPQAKLFWDRLLLSIPFVGNLVRRIEIARWARALALMVSSGVPILKALEISIKLTQNKVFEDLYQQAYISIQGGSKLADTLQSKNVFFGDAIQLIAAGENSGNLDKMLAKIAEYYDQLIKRTLKKMTSIIEPFFIIFMGIVIGFIMLSVMLPMFDMIKVLNSGH